MPDIKHPDPEKYWNRKWKLAIAGMFFSVCSIVGGMVIVLAAGPEYSQAISPLSISGMWGGLVPTVAYAAEAAVENIADARGR